MSLYRAIITHLPEVRGPTQKRLSFKEKLKWTLIILVLFFVLGTISLFGLDPAYQFRFEQLGIILGASFGTITSLGTSAASVITGTANGVNTLYGTTATIPTGITSVILNSPGLVRTDDYYIAALAFDAIKVERVNDGKVL